MPLVNIKCLNVPLYVIRGELNQRLRGDVKRPNIADRPDKGVKGVEPLTLTFGEKVELFLFLV